MQTDRLSLLYTAPSLSGRINEAKSQITAYTVRPMDMQFFAHRKFLKYDVQICRLLVLFDSYQEVSTVLYDG